MMNIKEEDFTFDTDGESIQYLKEIVEKMMLEHGILSKEAVGRINKVWLKVGSVKGEGDPIYRESPVYWAYHFYYGKDSFWWVERREENNLPPLKPLPYLK
ncbi:hypothetical protein [Aureispira anguillae]|uniref:Uncharacterized protein n=1 Tax=Aureispira anguillae TaxID=2864201 RepID=A0A916DTQ6_9BACT|nr:hypothetical protein [Aureispira anguillae]BDS12726.1 hypothetical protein AsAng_0034510 [Aureispira anguillae]